MAFSFWTMARSHSPVLTWMWDGMCSKCPLAGTRSLNRSAAARPRSGSLLGSTLVIALLVVVPLYQDSVKAVDLRFSLQSALAEEVDLTAYEYKVLEYLMLHAGEVISKNDLTEHIYHQDFDRDSNTLEVFVRRLRKKLDPDNSLGPIETLRGRGYRFRRDASTEC